MDFMSDRLCRAGEACRQAGRASPVRATIRLIAGCCVLFIIALLFTPTGCGDSGTPTVRDHLAATGRNPARSTTRAAEAKRPVAPTARGRLVATVNGQPIEHAELADLLIRAKGVGILQQLILSKAVEQEADRRGISAGEADVQREYDLAIEAEHFNGKDVEHLTPARREQIIEDWTRSRGVSRAELHLAMRRQALLRKMVAGQVKIDDDMLRKEFGRVHGEKVEIRHLQLAAPRYYEQIKKSLDSGERFEDLVVQYSQNVISREKLGLLPPFTATDTTVPAVFAKAAFSLQPGQYSNLIEAEGNFHVLKLERKLPPDPVTFDEVREKLRLRLAARLTVEAMQQLGSNLLMRSELKIEEPGLREEYRRKQATGEIVGPPPIGF